MIRFDMSSPQITSQNARAFQTAMKTVNTVKGMLEEMKALDQSPADRCTISNEVCLDDMYVSRGVARPSEHFEGEAQFADSGQATRMTMTSTENEKKQFGYERLPNGDEYFKVPNPEAEGGRIAVVQTENQLFMDENEYANLWLMVGGVADCKKGACSLPTPAAYS